MGIPGVEYFAHPRQTSPRAAKEFVFRDERISADKAPQRGMVNRVVERLRLDDETFAVAERIAEMPAFGLALAKRAVNQCEDLMGLRDGMDSVFGLHHLAHAYNTQVGVDSLAGLDARSMRQAPPRPE
jgi:enoyl-CoA hydratase